MKLVSYELDGGEVSAGVVVDDHVVALSALDGVPTAVTTLLATGSAQSGGLSGRSATAHDHGTAPWAA